MVKNIDFLKKQKQKCGSSDTQIESPKLTPIQKIENFYPLIGSISNHHTFDPYIKVKKLDPKSTLNIMSPYHNAKW